MKRVLILCLALTATTSFAQERTASPAYKGNDSAMAGQIASLRSLITVLGDQMASYKEDITNLNTTINNLNTKINNLETRITNIENNTTTATASSCKTKDGKVYNSGQGVWAGWNCGHGDTCQAFFMCTNGTWTCTGGQCFANHVPQTP